MKNKILTVLFNQKIKQTLLIIILLLTFVIGNIIVSNMKHKVDVVTTAKIYHENGDYYTMEFADSTGHNYSAKTVLPVGTKCKLTIRDEDNKVVKIASEDLLCK